MVMAEFSIFPVGKGESLSPYVARCTKIIRESGVKNELHAMGTILEGEWDEVFGVIRKCFEELRKDCSRISLTIKVDYR
ncbi:MAG: thiamine-binding protein, partial [Deltaproteobacteria bacterium]